MGKTYSIDLRERIVCGIDGGLSCRAAAVAFAVSASFAVKLKAYRAATGSVEPVRQGRPPGSGKLAPHLDFLVACVEERADITLPELAELLDAAHGEGSDGLVARAGVDDLVGFEHHLRVGVGVEQV